ncbi:MAG: YraN family protein [Armatimonadota bacterium]|nr:YraN family protein [Armatimonadota bacterium]MDR7519044.1 YraN family protein [Armatimonadota bacterium]MDR7549177.1 YraN family protein [Armatimonadota bacterium]
MERSWRGHGASRADLGTAGEQAAAAWLQTHGYEILDRNARTRYGEIDLVARIGDVVVFLEVKSRTSARFGHPAEAIVARKQRRLLRLAEAYLHSRHLEGYAVRFDAVAVHLDAAGRMVEIEHIPDAFRASG